MTMTSLPSDLFTAEDRAARASFSALAVAYSERERPRDWSFMWTTDSLECRGFVEVDILSLKNLRSCDDRYVLPDDG